jgi:hypothetical protein
MRNDDLNDYAYFAQVVAHGGFAAAGRRCANPSPSSAVASPRWKRVWAHG